MSLKLIYGRRGSGKTSYCFEAVATALKEKKKIIYIVPEQFSLESERRIAASFSATASSLLDVLSFERLAHQVFSRFGPLYQEYLNDAGKQMLAQKALLKVENKLTVLADAAAQPGFSSEILGMISEFRRHDVCYEQLIQIAERMENPILKLKLDDLSLIYRTFCNSIQNGMGDEEENLSILCERIKQFHLFTDTIFIIDQFHSFTPQEYNVIEALLRNCISMMVTITTDSLEKGAEDGIDVFSETKDTADRLFRIALDNGIKILPNTYVGGCKKYQNNEALAHLERNYFKYPGEVYEKESEKILIFQANHYFGEVEAAAKKIMKICREQGLKYRDIALVTRDETVYFPLVRNVFEEYEIPYFINDKKPATSHPLSRMLFALLSVFIHNWSSVYVLQFIKSGFLPLLEEDICFFENYVIASGLNYGQWTKEKPLTFLPQGFDAEDLVRINEIRSQIVKRLTDFKNKLVGRKKAGQIIKALYEFLIENEMDQKVQNKIDSFMQQSMAEQAKEWQLAWNAVVQTFDQMTEFLGEEFLSFERFSSVFISGLATFSLAQVPPMIDQVQLFSLDGFQSQNPKVLMVLGTTEGVFPKGYNNEGLLSDSDRRVLKENGLALAHDTIRKQMAEQFLIYQCITASADQLYLFYPSADHEGKSCNPSPIINRIRKLFPVVKQENNLFVREHPDEIEGIKPVFWKMVTKLAKKEPFDEIWTMLYAWYEKNQKEWLASAQGALTYTNLPKRLSTESKELLFKEIPYTSISRVEGYARCQFAHFLQYGLSIKTRKEYQLQAVDVGSLMHEIIEGFSLHIQGQPGGWKALNKSYADALVAKLCDEKLREYLGDAELGSTKFQQMSLKMKRIMYVTIWNIARFYQNSSFEPFGYELAFGEEDDLPPLEIELKNGQKVRLVGKVDRIDILRTEKGNLISIVDYKSSSKDMDYSYIMAGLQVQLPVYIDAICKALSKKENYPFVKAAMLYYKIDAPVIDGDQAMDEEEIWQATVKELKMRGIILEDEEKGRELAVVAGANAAISADKIDALCSFTRRKMQKIIEEMLSGSIQINPFRRGAQVACEFCPYLSVCQFDTDFKGNQYRSIRKIKKEEFFEYASKMD